MSASWCRVPLESRCHTASLLWGLGAWLVLPAGSYADSTYPLAAPESVFTGTGVNVVVALSPFVMPSGVSTPGRRNSAVGVPIGRQVCPYDPGACKRRSRRWIRLVIEVAADEHEVAVVSEFWKVEQVRVVTQGEHAPACASRS